MGSSYKLDQGRAQGYILTALKVKPKETFNLYIEFNPFAAAGLANINRGEKDRGVGTC